MTKARLLKKIALKTGLYHPGRLFYRCVVNRSRLRHSQQSVEFWRELVQPGDLCFDVGANIGEKTEISLRAGARVVAFEPQPACMSELRARCKQFSQLTTINAAVGRTAEILSLYIDESSLQSSLLPGWEGERVGSLDVPVVTLDAAIAKYGVPKYCKIDVEGWELEVLHGLSSRVPLVSFECHLNAKAIQAGQSCVRYLAALGGDQVNIVAEEETSFRLTSWMPLEDFLIWFPEGLGKNERPRYADIFVRSSG